MEYPKATFCRLCINIVGNENFVVIDESTREILQTVSLNLDLDKIYKHVMCSTCSVKLYSVFDFKSTCLYVEDKIVSHVNPRMSFVDLREVYLKEYNNKVKIKDNQKICRLCLQLVSEVFYEVKLETIHRYIPEVNIGVTEDPVVCRRCFDSLNVHDTFIKTCLDVEKQIHNINNKVAGLENSNTFINENDEIEFGEKRQMGRLIKVEKELKTEEMLIETEEINLKSEGNDCESDFSLLGSHNETVENKTRHTYKKEADIKGECMHKCETNGVQISKPEAELHITSYHSAYNKNELKGGLKQEAAPVHMCCKKSSRCLQLISKNPSEARLYKCDVCTFETKYKSDLRVHELKHKDHSEVQMYKCDTCTYKTKYKCSLKRHQLIHKHSSEIHMYKCDICTYETKHKSDLKVHQLIHKNPSEVIMYKCNACTYEAKRKSHLKAHQLLHKKPSELHMYKCDTCSYETKYKRCLKGHQLKHRDLSEIRTYKCDTCSYETKYKGYLKMHQLWHKESNK